VCHSNFSRRGFTRIFTDQSSRNLVLWIRANPRGFVAKKLIQIHRAGVERVTSDLAPISPFLACCVTATPWVNPEAVEAAFSSTVFKIFTNKPLGINIVRAYFVNPTPVAAFEAAGQRRGTKQ
jgi:hypothetical protein